MEEIPTKKTTTKVVIKFLMENIISRFGVPLRFIIDNNMCFKYEEFKSFYEDYGIIISYASSYQYPQGNG